jgi:hypothetical protein
MHGGYTPRPLLSAPACHSAQGGLCLFGCLVLAGCTAEIVIIQPPTQITVSQGLPPLQQAGPELSKPKPKTRSIVVRQGVPSLGQKAIGSVSGEFSQEYSDDFK